MLAVLRVRAWGTVCHVPLVESARFAVRNTGRSEAGTWGRQPAGSRRQPGLGAWVVWAGRSTPCCCAALPPRRPPATTQERDRTRVSRRNEEP